MLRILSDGKILQTNRGNLPKSVVCCIPFQKLAELHPEKVYMDTHVFCVWYKVLSTMAILDIFSEKNALDFIRF